jgi:hypothetical protein
MKRSDAQKKADAIYAKNNVKRVVIKLYKNTDAELIEWIESLDNKQGTIKDILRKNMK